MSVNMIELHSAKRRSAFVVLTGVAALIAGCAAPSGRIANSEAYPRAETTNYSASSLQEGDRVSITFLYSTNFNTVDRISLDGTLNLEAVGKVRAAGRTLQELETELVQRYQTKAGAKDIVTVKLILPAASVYVSGAVQRPGKLPLEHPITVLQAITEAGGYDPYRAKLSEVTVIRLDEQGRQQTYRLDLKRAMKGKEESPFFVRPFDTIHVPSKTFNY